MDPEISAETAVSVEERLEEYEELFKYRYTIHDEGYKAAIQLADNPAPLPAISSWPPVSRGRKPRDQHWRSGPPRRGYHHHRHHQRTRYHDNSRNMDYDEVLEGYSRSKRQKRQQQSYYDTEEKSAEDASAVVTMATTDDSDGVVISPPMASGGKEKPQKGQQQQQQQHVMSHFVPFSEAAIGMGLAENPVAPSDTDVKAILSYASVTTEARKDAPRATDKQQTVGGKLNKSEEFDTTVMPHRKHESNKRSHRKHKTRSREEAPVAAGNLLPQNLLPADLIEQDDEGETAPVVQVSNTKLIIRPPKTSSPEPHPVADAAFSTKKAAKKKKKKDKAQYSLKLKLKVQEDTAHIVP